MPNRYKPATLMGRIAATIPVRDIQKSADMYKSLFGFEVIFENGEPTGFMILKKDAAELHLTLQPEMKAQPFNVAHVLVPDALETFERCKGLGLRIIKGVQDKDYGLRAFVFQDIDGNRIDVGQSV